MLQTERMPDLVEVMRMGKDHRLKHRQLPLQVDENLTVSPGAVFAFSPWRALLFFFPRDAHSIRDRTAPDLKRIWLVTVKLTPSLYGDMCMLLPKCPTTSIRCATSATDCGMPFVCYLFVVCFFFLAPRLTFRSPALVLCYGTFLNIILFYLSSSSRPTRWPILVWNFKNYLPIYFSTFFYILINSTIAICQVVLDGIYLFTLIFTTYLPTYYVLDTLIKKKKTNW